MTQLCECGCGEEVKPGNKFIQNHYQIHLSNMKKEKIEEDRLKERETNIWSFEYYQNNKMMFEYKYMVYMMDKLNQINDKLNKED